MQLYQLHKRDWEAKLRNREPTAGGRVFFGGDQMKRTEKRKKRGKSIRR